MRSIYYAIIILLALVLPTRGQSVAIVTFGPGEMTFEKFGHTGLWIHDPANGLDIIYNWGLFDFDQPNLIGKFVEGRLLYWMEGFDADATFQWYRSQNRSIWVQELNLTGEQVEEIQKFLRWNRRPENRAYKYDYYRDNCTTRVRDLIDAVTVPLPPASMQTPGLPRIEIALRQKNSLGGLAKQALSKVPGTTYRAHTRRITASDVPLYAALETVLGPRVDQPISAWDEAFIPFEFQRRLRDVTIKTADGQSKPLVKREFTLFTATRPMPLSEPPFYLPWFGLVGIGIGGLILGLSFWAKKTRVGRLMFLFPVTIWSLVAGVAGGIMLFGWFFTDHVVSYRNENLLQTSPLLLTMPLLVFMGLVKTRWAGRAAQKLALVIAGLSILGLLLKAIPFFEQVNGEIIALALPVNLCLAWALTRLLPQWQLNKPNPSVSASLTGNRQQSNFP